MLMQSPPGMGEVHLVPRLRRIAKVLVGTRPKCLLNQVFEGLLFNHVSTLLAAAGVQSSSWMLGLARCSLTFKEQQRPAQACQ